MHSQAATADIHNKRSASQAEIKVLKIDVQAIISHGSCGRRVMSPFGVAGLVIHLVMCSLLHQDFFPFSRPPPTSFFYLAQSHFVVFQPFPSHILCLWLSLDFSQTDKLISFIHT